MDNTNASTFGVITYDYAPSGILEIIATPEQANAIVSALTQEQANARISAFSLNSSLRGEISLIAV